MGADPCFDQDVPSPAEENCGAAAVRWIASVPQRDGASARAVDHRTVMLSGACTLRLVAGCMRLVHKQCAWPGRRE